MQDRATAIHTSGGKTFAEITRALTPDEAAALDFGSYEAESAFFARHLGMKEQKLWEPSSAMEYYSWQAWRENPLKNRLLCGIFLWRWGLDGAMPDAYQQWVGDDPYLEGAKEEDRPHMLTYPSLRGPVPTLQWKACQEGIFDLRYAATLEFWMTKAKREVNRLIEAGMDSGSARSKEIMKAYSFAEATLEKSRARITAHPGETLKFWSAPSFEDLRREITDSILELQRALKAGAG
jgi:hypothetical protein